MCKTAVSNMAYMSACFCWIASEGRGCSGLGCVVAGPGSCLVSSTTLGTHTLGFVGSIPENI